MTLPRWEKTSPTIGAAMLLPEQLQRHTRPAQLAMDRRPVRLRPLILGRGRRRRVETALQRLVGQVLRQRPAEANPPGSTNTLTCRRRADAKAGGNLAFGHAAGAEPKHVVD